MFSKLTTKTIEQRQWRRSGVFTVNFEHISCIFFSVSIVDFELVNFCWSANQNTVWKVSVFEVILVRNFPHSDWIRTKYARTLTLFTQMKNSEILWASIFSSVAYLDMTYDRCYCFSYFLKSAGTRFWDTSNKRNWVATLEVVIF